MLVETDISLAKLKIDQAMTSEKISENEEISSTEIKNKISIFYFDSLFLNSVNWNFISKRIRYFNW